MCPSSPNGKYDFFAIALDGQRFPNTTPGDLVSATFMTIEGADVVNRVMDVP
jgi:hypothetical protein